MDDSKIVTGPTNESIQALFQMLEEKTLDTFLLEVAELRTIDTFLVSYNILLITNPVRKYSNT